MSFEQIYSTRHEILRLSGLQVQAQSGWLPVTDILLLHPCTYPTDLSAIYHTGATAKEDCEWQLSLSNYAAPSRIRRLPIHFQCKFSISKDKWVCGIFSDSILLSSSGWQQTAVAIACIIWGPWEPHLSLANKKVAQMSRPLLVANNSDVLLPLLKKK